MHSKNIPNIVFGKVKKLENERALIDTAIGTLKIDNFYSLTLGSNVRLGIYPQDIFLHNITANTNEDSLMIGRVISVDFISKTYIIIVLNFNGIALLCHMIRTHDVARDFNVNMQVLVNIKRVVLIDFDDVESP